MRTWQLSTILVATVILIAAVVKCSGRTDKSVPNTQTEEAQNASAGAGGSDEPDEPPAPPDTPMTGSAGSAPAPGPGPSNRCRLANGQCDPRCPMLSDGSCLDPCFVHTSTCSPDCLLPDGSCGWPPPDTE